MAKSSFRGWTSKALAKNGFAADGAQDHTTATAAKKKTAAHVGRIVREARQNGLASRFDFLWRALGGGLLETEVVFDPARKWRFDYADAASRVAIELDGGVHSSGRHTRGRGYIADCEKLNAAARQGWTVFRLATGMITSKHVQPIIDTIGDRLERRD